MSNSFFLERIKEAIPTEKEQLIRRIEEMAYYGEKVFGGPARSIVRSIQQHLKLGDELVLFKAADCLQGTVFFGEVCSAFLGGVLVIGSVYGREDWDSILVQWKDRPGWQPETEAKRRALSFTTRFKECFGGSIKCWDIQRVMCGRSYDMTNPEEAAILESPEVRVCCSELAKKAARLATEVILEPGKL